MTQYGFEKLTELMRAHRKSSAFLVAHELGVLDKLSIQQTKSDTLAHEMGLSEQGLDRLLSALCAMGILNKSDNNYKLIKEYEKYFNPQSKDYIGGLLNHEIHLQKRWMRLAESLKSGNPVKKYDESTNPEDINRFIKAMTTIGQRTAPIMLEKIRFNGNERLLDLGGGPGKYLEKFCEHYPQMQVTLFDQPETILAAKSSFSDTKYYENMEFLSGDFCEDNIGGDYDVIFNSNVIHIYGTQEIKRIFDKCYLALKPNGRLLIKDFFLNNDRTGPEFSTLFSLHMLLSTEKGQCYSESEMISLMESSKFSHKKTTTLTESTSVIEGIK